MLCRLYVLPVSWKTLFSPNGAMWAKFKDDTCFVHTYVSSSSPGGGTRRTPVNVVWSASQRGGIGGKVCRLRLHIVCSYLRLSFRVFFVIGGHLLLTKIIRIFLVERPVRIGQAPGWGRGFHTPMEPPMTIL